MTGKFSSTSGSQTDVEYAITSPASGYVLEYRVNAAVSKSTDNTHRMTTFYQTTEDW
jgi:hypothetical protein